MNPFNFLILERWVQAPNIACQMVKNISAKLLSEFYYLKVFSGGFITY